MCRVTFGHVILIHIQERPFPVHSLQHQNKTPRVLKLDKGSKPGHRWRLPQRQIREIWFKIHLLKKEQTFTERDPLRIQNKLTVEECM